MRKRLPAWLLCRQHHQEMLNRLQRNRPPLQGFINQEMCAFLPFLARSVCLGIDNVLCAPVL